MTLPHDLQRVETEIATASRLLLLASLWVLWGLALARFGQSLWLDEASSVWFARFPLPTLLTTLCDPHPPGYYLLLKGWISLFGSEKEFWLRFPSLLAAVLSVVLAYRLGVRAWGKRGGWLAAMLLALQPMQAWYASEARMYALTQLLGLLTVWLGMALLSFPGRRQAVEKHAGGDVSPSPRSSVLSRQSPVASRQSPNPYSILFTFYWLVATVALWVDFSAFLAFAVLQLIWLAQGRPDARRWLAIQAAVLLPTLLFWMGLDRFAALGSMYHSVFLAVAADSMGFRLTPLAASRLIQAGLVLVALLGVGGAWLWPSKLARWYDRPAVRWLVIGGWLVLLFFSGISRLFTVKRLLVVLLPYLALIVAHALSRLPGRASFVVLGVGLLVTFSTLATHQREPWRYVVGDGLTAVKGSTGAVLWVDELAVPVFEYYVRQAEGGDGTVSWSSLFGQTLPHLPDLSPQPGADLWLLTVENRYRHLPLLLPAAFQQNYDLLDVRHALGIGLYQYRRREKPGRETTGLPPIPAAVRWGLLLPSPLDTCGAQ